MSNLFEKFAALKRQIAGNREKMGYEFSFGMTREEQSHITPPPRYIVRILSELEYAIRLSEYREHAFDTLVDGALDFLADCMESEGAVTRTAASACERLLLPLADAAREFSLILVGHAHIDMNWMWSFDETVAATVATFTTMLRIMDEYPTFTYAQSQTSVYKIIDDYAPALKPRILERIREGRWEITSSAWVETDKNMPDGESLLRHIRLTKEYLRDHWDIDPASLDIDFSPDTFGHSANIPEIDRSAGVKYMYHCRGLDGDNALYRWRGASGAELLVYREQDWYNSAVNPEIAMRVFDISKRCAGLKTGLVVYGVGDHGGGPTRRDVERALEMMEWPVFPAIRFGTFGEYFRIAESVREALPVVAGEMNCTFPGCYTTQSRIKRGNRRSERALLEAESAVAMAHLGAGYRMPHHALDTAWQNTLFTHFHDILTGSCVQDSREYAMGLFQTALSTAQTTTSLALSALSDRIDTTALLTDGDANAQSEGAGVGYGISAFAGHAVPERGMGLTRVWHVFNTTAAAKSEPVEITVWDWVGDMRYLRVTDADGKELPFQMLDGGLQHYWDHKFFRFLVRVALPAFSYATVVLRPRAMETYPVHFQGQIRTDHAAQDFVLDNGRIRAVFDRTNGELLSLQAADGREMLSGRGGLTLVDTTRRGDSAWQIGDTLAKTPVTDTANPHYTCGGPLRSGFGCDYRIRSSRVSVEYTLDAGDDFLRVHIHADWSEVGGEKIPVLVYGVPLRDDVTGFAYDAPAASVERPAADADRPGLTHIAAVAAGETVPAIVSDSKYGFRGMARDALRGEPARMQCTLINSAVNPDPYPERGIHDITLCVGYFAADPAERKRQAIAANAPAVYVSASRHAGTLAPVGTLLDADAGEAVITAMWEEDGAIHVRAYAPESATVLRVRLPEGYADAAVVDTMGTVLRPCAIANGYAECEIPARAILTLRVQR